MTVIDAVCQHRPYGAEFVRSRTTPCPLCSREVASDFARACRRRGGRYESLPEVSRGGWTSGLRRFLALLTFCDWLLCSQSGAVSFSVSSRVPSGLVSEPADALLLCQVAGKARVAMQGEVYEKEDVGGSVDRGTARRNLPSTSHPCTSLLASHPASPLAAHQVHELPPASESVGIDINVETVEIMALRAPLYPPQREGAGLTTIAVLLYYELLLHLSYRSYALQVRLRSPPVRLADMR